MRVIHGTYRGRRLQSLPEKSKIRPVRDSQKEVIFNVLTCNSFCQYKDQPAYMLDVLDVFAGTGSLGIEALSRGARSVIFIDVSENSHEIIKRNLQMLKIDDKKAQLHKKNVLYLGVARQKYHLAFLDPPFGHNILGQALQRLHQKQWLHPQALCVAKISSREKTHIPEPFIIVARKDTRDESIMFLRYQPEKSDIVQEHTT